MILRFFDSVAPTTFKMRHNLIHTPACQNRLVVTCLADGFDFWWGLKVFQTLLSAMIFATPNNGHDVDSA